MTALAAAPPGAPTPAASPVGHVSGWRSMRTNVALMLAVIATIASGAAGVASYNSTSDSLNREIDRSVISSVESAATRARRIAPPAGANNRPPATSAQGGPPSTGPVEVARVSLDDAGETITVATIELPSADLPIADPDRVALRTLSVGGESYRVGTLAIGPNEIVLGVRNTAESSRVLSRLRTKILLGTLAVVLVGAALGWMIAERISRRLRRLAAAAEQIGRTGDLTHAVPVEGRDEAAVLAVTLNNTIGALRSSQAQQRRLIQDAGHELRTPLTSLTTNIAMLKKFDGLAPDQRQGLVDDLESEARELVDLANELVELATDQHQLEQQSRVDLRAVADAVAERLSRRYSRTITVSGESALVWAPRQGLERAVVNLVGNAAKFDTTSGPIEIRVTEQALSVLDRGPGIDPREHALVFDRFYRSDAARSAPGSGLGLAIVADIVSRAGGRTFVRNRPGGGAEVGFTLPAFA